MKNKLNYILSLTNIKVNLRWKRIIGFGQHKIRYKKCK